MGDPKIVVDGEVVRSMSVTYLPAFAAAGFVCLIAAGAILTLGTGGKTGARTKVMRPAPVAAGRLARVPERTTRLIVQATAYRRLAVA